MQNRARKSYTPSNEGDVTALLAEPESRHDTSHDDNQDVLKEERWWDKVGEIAKVAMIHQKYCLAHPPTIMDQLKTTKGALQTFAACLNTVLECVNEVEGNDDRLTDMAMILLNMVLAMVEMYGCWNRLQSLMLECPDIETKKVINEESPVIQSVERLITLFEDNAALQSVVETYCESIAKHQRIFPESGLYPYLLRSKEGRLSYAKLIIHDFGAVREALDVDEILDAAIAFAYQCRGISGKLGFALLQPSLQPPHGISKVAPPLLTMSEEHVSSTSLVRSSLKLNISGKRDRETNCYDPGSPEVRRSKRVRKPRIIKD